MSNDPNKDLEDLFKNDMLFNFNKKMYESNPQTKAMLDIFRKYGMTDENSVLALAELGTLDADENNNFQIDAKLNRVFNKTDNNAKKLDQIINLLEGNND
ncbi:hypothetical protein [Staphylococcus saprophyticus]|uniref:hypothetical protein n=1 Tax=Staphylococcus saprophyticus TaxID=29385 RepID=UPI0038224D03